jgi:ribosome-interacting GTPase 1
MARTQKNKATSGHLGLLKAKLAKLRRELMEPQGGGGGPKEAGMRSGGEIVDVLMPNNPTHPSL